MTISQRIGNRSEWVHVLRQLGFYQTDETVFAKDSTELVLVRKAVKAVVEAEITTEVGRNKAKTHRQQFADDAVADALCAVIADVEGLDLGYTTTFGVRRTIVEAVAAGRRAYLDETRAARQARLDAVADSAVVLKPGTGVLPRIPGP